MGEVGYTRVSGRVCTFAHTGGLDGDWPAEWNIKDVTIPVLALRPLGATRVYSLEFMFLRLCPFSPLPRFNIYRVSSNADYLRAPISKGRVDSFKEIHYSRAVIFSRPKRTWMFAYFVLFLFSSFSILVESVIRRLLVGHNVSPCFQHAEEELVLINRSSW